MTATMDAQRLAQLQDVIRADIAAGLYHGAVIKVARGGKVALEAAIGAADAEQKLPLALSSVFSIFSVTKAFTNVLVLQAIEQGRFALTTPISDLIPEFKGFGREKVQMWHLLSHQAGFPILFEVRPGWYINNFDEVSSIVIADVKPVDEPCAKVSYSPLVNHVLMAEALLRTDPKKRGYRQLVQQEILDPLQMRDTSVGLRADLKSAQGGAGFPRQLSHRPQEPQCPGPQWRLRGRDSGDALGGRRVDHAGHVPLRRNAAPGRHAGRRAPAVAGDDQVRSAQLDRREDQRAVRRSAAGKRGWIRRPPTSAWDSRCAARRMCPTYLGTLASPGTYRQLRRRHDAVLGRSRARHHLCLPDGRRDAAQRQYAPLPEVRRHDLFGAVD